MTVFVAWPWLALVPAGLLVVAFARWRSRLAIGSAVGWVGYACYEYAMQRRWLCTGECNIRVDLLLIYPVLFLLTVGAVVRTIRRWRRIRSAV